MTSDDQEVPTVFVVDEDPASRGAWRSLLQSVGLRVEVFPDVEAFSAAYHPERAGCLLLELGPKDLEDLESQRQLMRRAIDLPAILLAERAEVAVAVAAMKNGAFDFIEKPYNEQFLLDGIERALKVDRKRRRALAYRHRVVEDFRTLTPREQEVMDKVVHGMVNKEIADDLDVSRKTVEVHRAKVMTKMQAESFSELIQMALIVGMLPDYADEDDPDE